jgi:NADPH:quinone reductase-like Zn-dependent oxidoreductase
LTSLGAKHVINYKTNPVWGQTAKELSANGEGIDNVLDIGGGDTLFQSLNSIKIGGVVTVIGILDGFNPMEWPSMMQTLAHMCTVRAIAVGSRAQFEDMVKAIDANGIKPVLNNRTFKFEEMKEAYKYLVRSLFPSLALTANNFVSGTKNISERSLWMLNKCSLVVKF